MTLENTRAAGLRQAAEYLREKCREMELDAIQTGNADDQRRLSIRIAALWAAAIELDRLAQEAERCVEKTS